MKLPPHKIITLFTLVLAFMFCLACSNNEETTVVFYDQIDRIGRPAIGTVFIHTNGDPTFDAASDTQKNSFNTGVPSDDVNAWTGTFKTSLTTFRSLYGGSTSDIDTYAGILIPDVLTMDISRSGASSYLGDILGSTSDGGRALADDVIDASLSTVVFPSTTAAVVSGFHSDYVGSNDKTFSSDFPYLADPH